MLRRGFAVVFLGLTALLGAQTKTISVGWSVFPPYQIPGQTVPTGIDCDIMAAVAQKAGYTVSFQQLPWARQLSLCQNGGLDIVMLASKNAERAVWAEFTESYRQERNAVMALATDANPPASLQDILTRKEKLGILRDSYYGEKFAEMMKNSAFTALLDQGTDTLTNLNKLSANRFKYLVDDPASVDYQVKLGNLSPLKPAFFLVQDDVFFMISKVSLGKDPQLKEKLNLALAALKADGTIAKIMAKYRN